MHFLSIITSERARDYLCCVADLYSRMPALEYVDSILERQLLNPKAIFSPYITILNNTLYHNPSITLISQIAFKQEKMSSILSTCVGLLSGSLRKDSKIARLHLRRSKSFHNLEFPDHHASPPLQRAHSCPDLSGIRHMYPQFHYVVMTSTSNVRFIGKFHGGLHVCKHFITKYWKYPF